MDVAKIRIGQIDLRDLSSSELASANSVNLVQDNVVALTSTAAANDFATYTTLDGRINTVQDNVSSLDNNAWVNSNDYATYSTLSGLINTVQDNVSSQTSNTQLYIGDTLLSNTALILEAGNGISISANATTHVTTITTSMSNVTSQEIAIDGSSNSFTLVKSAANTNMLLVSYEGILQKPREYDVSGTTLTLSNTRPLVAGANLEVRYFDFFDLSGVSAGGGGGYSFQGSVSGYASGGSNPPASTYVNTIDKFPFSSDSNATDVGDLTIARAYASGQSSSSSGYTSGGATPSNSDVIDKFPFSSDGNATDVGNLLGTYSKTAGQSSDSSGYNSGGLSGPVNIIQKFSFSTDGNASDVGDLTQARSGGVGQSSSVSGYTSGGDNPSVNTIDKFPFASDANASDVGDMLFSPVVIGASQSSDSHGYISGGFDTNVTNIIQKFPFSTDSNASDVGDLTQTRYGAAGQSSTDSGYTSGGSNGTTPHYNTIDKFPFSSDSNASDVGDLTQTRRYIAGQQV